MNSYAKWFSAAGIASVAMMVLADGNPGGTQPASPPDAEALRKEITELRERVETLENRTRELESRVQTFSTPHLSPPGSTPPNSFIFKSPSDNTPPRVWGEKKVNGWTFYIVPCEQQAH